LKDFATSRESSVADVRLGEHAPHNAMDDPGEIARFYDRCSDLMRELLDALADAPDQLCSAASPTCATPSSPGAVPTASGTRNGRHRAAGSCGWTPGRRAPCRLRGACSQWQTYREMASATPVSPTKAS
jgi:hypothetical protein